MAKSILLTCGLGDFIAIESYLSVRELYDVENIYWATIAENNIMPLVPHVFPNIKKHISLSIKQCIEYKWELQDNEYNMEDVQDYGISALFKQSLLKQRIYQGSSLIRKKLSDITYLQLPKNYIVVHPYSENAPTEARDINAHEWDIIKTHLLDKGVKIVIVNKGQLKMPSHPNLIDLTNNLNILEAIEVVKLSNGFIGASSVFSVIASKVLPQWKIYVKGHNLLKDIYWKFYYAPLETNHFIQNALIMAYPVINFLD